MCVLVKGTEMVGGVGQIVWLGTFSFSSQQACQPPGPGNLPDWLEAAATESLSPGKWGDIGNGVLEMPSFQISLQLLHVRTSVLQICLSSRGSIWLFSAAKCFLNAHLALGLALS